MLQPHMAQRSNGPLPQPTSGELVWLAHTRTQTLSPICNITTPTDPLFTCLTLLKALNFLASVYCFYLPWHRRLGDGARPCAPKLAMATCSQAGSAGQPPLSRVLQAVSTDLRAGDEGDEVTQVQSYGALPLPRTHPKHLARGAESHGCASNPAACRLIWLRLTWRRREVWRAGRDV
jgi:hypothetical protein